MNLESAPIISRFCVSYPTVLAILLEVTVFVLDGTRLFLNTS